MANYKYSYHEERGEFHAYVEDMNGKTVWEVHYPDFYEDEESGELIESSTIFEDGFMKDVEDVEGLEDYLKSLGILHSGDELEVEGNYAEGGRFDGGTTLEKVKVTIKDVDMGGDVVYQQDHWFIKDQLDKKTNKQIGDFILKKYGLDYGNTYTYSIKRTGETKERMASGGKINYAKGGGVSKKEYIVWGIPPNKKYEEPLITKAKSLSEANNYCKLLTEKYGCKNCRVQVLDLSGNVDLSKMFTKTIKRNHGGIMASGGALETKLKKKLNKSFELPMEMAVYVPSTDKANIIISKRDYASRIEEVERYLSNLFGGYSAVSVDGGYVSDDKGLIQEDVTRVATFGSTEDFESKFNELVNQVVDWCNKWGQESMGFEFEGDMFYINKEASFEEGGMMRMKGVDLSKYENIERIENFYKVGSKWFVDGYKMKHHAQGVGYTKKEALEDLDLHLSYVTESRYDDGGIMAKGGNVPTIQKRVEEVNALIKEGNDKGLQVVDTSSTWESPMKYKPFKYSNGVLYEEYEELDLYKYNKGQGTYWVTKKYTTKKSGMGIDDQKGILNNVARMYRKAIKHYNNYGY